MNRRLSDEKRLTLPLECLACLCYEAQVGRRLVLAGAPVLPRQAPYESDRSMSWSLPVYSVHAHGSIKGLVRAHMHTEVPYMDL